MFALVHRGAQRNQHRDEPAHERMQSIVEELMTMFGVECFRQLTVETQSTSTNSGEFMFGETLPYSVEGPRIADGVRLYDSERKLHLYCIMGRTDNMISKWGDWS